MAFGLGFNKAKALSAAEKSVMQGKIPAAIQEYQKILDNEPRDLTILNIVGDLYLRINKSDEALKCFYKLGEAYLDDGFTRNAIAVYRRICRVDASAIDAIMRLAELYTLQGQLNEARAQYQLAGEYYAQRKETAKCVDVMEKTLLLDPENVAAKQRLAQLYEQANRREEAAGMYLSAAEGQADRGSPADAEKLLKRACELGVSGPAVIVLRARIQVEDGRAQEAVETFKDLPPENTDKAALNILFHAYSALEDWNNAGAIARRLLDEYDDVAGLAMVCDRLLDHDRYADALENYQHMADRLIAQKNTSPLVEGLRKIAEAQPNSVEALRLLRHVYQETDQNASLVETTAQLARAYDELGEYADARELLQELLRDDPENQQYLQDLQQIDAHLGKPVAAAAPPLSPMDAAFAEELDVSPPAAVVEQPLTAEEQELLNNAMTESDLFLTYHQMGRAIQALEPLLGRLPQNAALNERLLELYERAARYDKALERCQALNDLYQSAGDDEKAATYSEMLPRLREKAGQAPPSAEAPATGLAATPPAEIPEFTIPAPPAEFPIGAAPSADASAVREVDLSDWESMLVTQEEPAPAPIPSVPENLAQGSEQIEAYLRDGRIAEATTALSQLQEKFPGSAEVEALAERVAMAAMGLPAEAAAAAPGPEAEAAATTAEPPGEPEAAATVQEIQFSAFSDTGVAEPAPIAWPETSATGEVALGLVPGIAEAAPEQAAPPVEEAQPIAWPETQAPAWPEPRQPVPPVSEPTAESAARATAPSAEPAAAPSPEFVLPIEEHPVAADEGFELALEEEPAHVEPVPPPARTAPVPPPAPPPAQAAPVPAPAPPPSTGMGDLVSAIEGELSGVSAPAKPSAPPPPPAGAPGPVPPAVVAAAPGPASAPAGSGKGALDDVFEDFKKGMEETSADTDIETHFNMGVAYEEMRLFDEAIGELQKAYQAAERAKSYGNCVRCCSLLAHCFKEKGLPLPAVRWLENGLKAPGLEQEDVLALRYEIGAAYEMAGNSKAALDSFMEVYALNIDYRDVADRIRELQGK